MTKKVRKARDYMLFVVGILFISFLVNVLLSVKNYKANYILGKESYKKIESVRSTNESNVEILKEAIDMECIDNMQLLKLYKNFSDISDTNIDLWGDYILYEDDNAILKTKKRINKNEDILADVNTKIEEYLLALLEREMKTQSYKLELQGEVLDKFNTMKQLSQDVSYYYHSFYTNNGLLDIEGESKIKKIVNNNSWIDILEGINYINAGYIDTIFIIE